MLKELELKCARSVLDELSVRVLYCLLSTPSVVLRVNCLNRDHDRIVVIFNVEEVVFSVLSRVDESHIGWELLLEPGRELVSIRTGKIRVCVETEGSEDLKVLERDVGSVSAFLSAQVNCDHAFVVRIEFEI